MAIRRYNPGSKPPATMALVVINVAIALVDLFISGYLKRLMWARGIDIQYGEWWRIITSGFAHGDLMHVGFNAYGIYLLGTIIERLHGWKPMLIIYFASMFGGTALAMTFMDPATPLLGASGAAYGLFGAVLGFFYAKTGSFKALLEIPFARMLLIWLAFGVFMSLQPGVSMLGHLGGFIPGVILGMFFEHRYARQLDIYHKLAGGMVIVVIVLLTAFSVAPFTRGSWYAARAMKAYEHDDLDKGDELLSEAKRHKHSQEGTQLLLSHLEVWRRNQPFNSKEFNKSVLLWPLTHPDGIQEKQSEGSPYDFLMKRETATSDPLESTEDEP